MKSQFSHDGAHNAGKKYLNNDMGKPENAYDISIQQSIHKMD